MVAPMVAPCMDTEACYCSTLVLIRLSKQPRHVSSRGYESNIEGELGTTPTSVCDHGSKIFRPAWVVSV